MTKEIEDFPHRLKLAIGKGSARAFALRCGLSPTGIHQYLTGKTEPTRLALIAMSQAACVNLEWLITGDGCMMKGKGSVMIDRNLYEEIIESVEESLMAFNKTLPLRKKLDACRYLYDFFQDMQGVDKEQTARVMRLLV